jgi:hypothetical protein
MRKKMKIIYNEKLDIIGLLITNKYGLETIKLFVTNEVSLESNMYRVLTYKNANDWTEIDFL